MKNYKSINQKLNESRNHYKSLLNEQVTITGVNSCKCEQWDGTNCGEGLMGMTLRPFTNNGNDAQIGDVYAVDATTGTLAGTEWVVVSMSSNNSGNGIHSTSIAGCGMGESGCDLATFTNLMGPGLGSVPNQFMQQLTQNWLPMFHDKYFNHPDGCRFLNKRLDINQAKLDQLINAGTNPQWQAMLTGKIMAIQAVIDNCCD